MHVEKSPLAGVRASIPSLEKWLGMAFSIVMSGVFSRMIRDPAGERYHDTLAIMGTSEFASVMLAITFVVILVYYYGDRLGIWVPQAHQYYATIIICLVALYMAGYVAVDNPLVAGSVLLFSGGLLTVLAVKKDSWGIADVGILRRLIGPG